LPGERTRLGQAGAAAPFGSRSDAGVKLLFGQFVAILARSGGQTRPTAQLAGRARVSRFLKKMPLLLAAHDLEHPVAAPTAL
jgi:hypothetical protein